MYSDAHEHKPRLFTPVPGDRLSREFQFRSKLTSLIMLIPTGVKSGNLHECKTPGTGLDSPGMNGWF